VLFHKDSLMTDALQSICNLVVIIGIVFVIFFEKCTSRNLLRVIRKVTASADL